MTFEKRSSVDELTERINGCAFKVHNKLGAGFLEKVYENALAVEMRKAGLEVAQQVRYAVHYDDAIVGEYVADLLVEKAVVVEAKACEGLAGSHRAQCVNYLKASGLGVGLILNFGTHRMEVRRIVRRQPATSVGSPAALTSCTAPDLPRPNPLESGLVGSIR